MLTRLVIETTCQEYYYTAARNHVNKYLKNRKSSKIEKFSFGALANTR